MGRIYRVSFEGVAVSAAQDLVQIKGATGKIVRILKAWVMATDTSLPTSQMLQLRCRYLPTTVTDGSGGAAGTVSKTDPGDAAASFTALINNTTKATTNGTAIIQEEAGCHIYQGYRESYPEFPVGPSESWVFELLSIVSGTVHLSGGVELVETGG